MEGTEHKLRGRQKPLHGQRLEARRSELKLSLALIEKMTDGLIYTKLLNRLELGDKSPESLAVTQFNALAKVLRWSPEQLAQALGLSGPTTSDPLAELKVKGDKEVASFLAQRTSWQRVPFYASGAGPFKEDEDIAGYIAIDDDRFLARYPEGVYFRIDGKCMEPDWPEGWFASVIPDPALAQRGSVVAVWLSDNGRVLKRLYEYREDGDHVLYQDNPPLGQSHLIVAPLGSRILGVAVDVRRGGIAPFKISKMDEIARRELDT